MSAVSNIEQAGPRKPTGRDHGAFRELVDTHRADLHAHCYRMLSSLHDADDALQETLLRAWRALPGSAARARCAPGCTGSPPMSAWTRSPAGPSACCRSTTALRPRHVTATGERPRRRGVDRALSRRGRRDRRRRRWTRGALRTARGARARVRRGAAASFAPSACCTDPARRPRLVGSGDRRDARDTEPSVNGALRRARATIDERLPDPSQQVTLVRSAIAGCERSWSDSPIPSSAATGAIVELLSEDATSRCRRTGVVPRSR